MNDIDNFILRLETDQAKIAEKLRDLIRSNFTELEEIYSWKMPVYVFDGKKVVYLQAGKSGINLGFNFGASLNEPKGLFEGGGKQMRHIVVSSVDDIDANYFSELVKQAIKQAQDT